MFLSYYNGMDIGEKCVFKYQYFQMFDLNPLEVVGRGSETQLQESEILNELT